MNSHGSWLNMARKFLFLAFATLAFVSPASYAADKIEGAFGKKLGEIFDPATAVGECSHRSNGEISCKFNPESPFRSFTDYYVYITPTTHKIYNINAMRMDYEDHGAAKSELGVIMEVLTQKYGPPRVPRTPPMLYPDDFDSKVIVQGQREIRTIVMGRVLHIFYSDDDLKILSERERLAIEIKKADSKGL